MNPFCFDLNTEEKTKMISITPVIVSTNVCAANAAMMAKKRRIEKEKQEKEKKEVKTK